VVFYNRCNEAAGRLKPGDFNWSEIFSGGVRWFHSGGIFAALSPPTAEVVIEGMQAAKAAGAIVSFDLNYRQKLWNISGGEARAAEVLGRIVKNVDVLVGNEEDLQKGLGIAGPEVAAKSKLDPSAFVKMIEQAVAKHPQIQVVATTLREVHSTNRHHWSAVAWVNGEVHNAPVAELDVYDRVGGGDGFAAGFFYGLLTGAEPAEAVKLGWAHGALLTPSPVTPPWRRSTRSAPSPKAAPPEFNGRRSGAVPDLPHCLDRHRAEAAVNPHDATGDKRGCLVGSQIHGRADQLGRRP